MKHSKLVKSAIGVALVGSLLSASTVASFATPQSDYKAAVTVFKADLVKWQLDRSAALAANKTLVTAYHAAIAANTVTRKAANTAFKSALDAAKATYTTAAASAKTAAEKTAAITARKVAIADATTARGLIIKAIVVPTKPAKLVIAPRPVAPVKPVSK